MRAVQRRPDQLGHAGVEHDLPSRPVTDMEDARDEPAGTRHQHPAGFDRDARRAAILRHGGKQWPELAGEPFGCRGRRSSGTDREAAAEVDGVERLDRAPPERGQRERLPDGVAPRVDGAELRPDVEMDAAWAQWSVRAATRFDRGRDLGLGHTELGAPRADSKPGQRLSGDVRVEPVEHVERWRPDPGRFVGERGGLLGRLDGDPT